MSKSTSHYTLPDDWPEFVQLMATLTKEFTEHKRVQVTRETRLIPKISRSVHKVTLEVEVDHD